MRVYDVSIPLTPETPLWPGDPPLRLEKVTDMDEGARYNLTRVSMSLHSGTHVDAPSHFIQSGDCVEDMGWDSLIGPVQVVQIDAKEAIDDAALEDAGIQPGQERVIFRTSNSDIWLSGDATFRRSFVALDISGAEWLARRSMKLVGIDYLSISKFGMEEEVHRKLLQAKIVVLEGLDLRSVTAGEYALYCLPMKFEGVEAAPARAILVEGNLFH